MNEQPTTHGGKRRGAGRKPIADEPIERHTVTLPASVAARLTRAGDGNLSAGIRRLLDVQPREADDVRV